MHCKTSRRYNLILCIGKQKPFGLPEQLLPSFSEALDDTQKLELDKMLRRVQLDWMLGVIYQLVELYLKDDKEKDSPLVPQMFYPWLRCYLVFISGCWKF